jgi:hypothetical protein
MESAPPNQNYRKTFIPQQQESQYSQTIQYSHNPTFKNAAQTMLDQKENFNYKNAVNNGPTNKVMNPTESISSYQQLSNYQSQASLAEANPFQSSAMGHNNQDAAALAQAQDFTL